MVWLGWRLYRNNNKNHTYIELAYDVSKRQLVASLALFYVIIMIGL